MVGLESNEWLTNEQFETIWAFCVNIKVENLFTKILACKHLKFLDLFSTYVVIGDVGAHIYFYYVGCEEQL